MSLGLALLALGDAGAAALFADLTTRHDVQEVWFGLSAACRRAGDAAGAAAALAAGLSGHVLADEASAAALAAGQAWCGRRPDGSLAIVCAERPDIDAAADGIAVTLGGRHLLGSPLRLAAMRRVEGSVWATPQGIAGWAWHPGDAGRDPVLEIAAGGRVRRITATDQSIAAPRALTRVRGFAVAGLSGKVSVRGADGRALAGSPIDAGAAARAAAAAAGLIALALLLVGRMQAPPWLPMPAGLRGAVARAARRPRRRVAVVVPAYRGAAMTRACLAAVAATAPAGTQIVVVDDASPEPELVAMLDALAAAGRIMLLRQRANGGFPAAANAGLRAAAALAGAPDLVLLNSDTLPAPGWLDRLRAAVQGTADVGTASPLSNDATILTYAGEPPPGVAPSPVEIPTAVGFCMYIRRECLAATGLLRQDAFAQGYGEENDFCLRATALGWRHVAVPGAYVAHRGGQSFGTAKAALLARNLDVLERLHPGYASLIADWQRADKLAPARRALDAARFAARPRSGQAVVLVTHDHQGGVERAVQAHCAAIAAAGLRPLLLRPVPDTSGRAEALARRYLPGICAVDLPAGGFADLRFRLPDEMSELVALLREEAVARVELHHLLGHDHAVTGLAAALGVPCEVRVHDYAWFCPRINLVGAESRYCGEPDLAGCEACVADAGSALEEAIGPAALVARSAADLAAAARVVVPSNDAAARLRRHFPALRPEVIAHEDDAALPPLRPPPDGPRRVGVVGAIGIPKGYDVLLACARDAARRDLALSFTVIGHTHDDARLLDTGRVFVTGPFRAAEAPALLRAEGVHLAFLPSIWPETWCYALGDALRAGLAVAAFDLGAPAERIRRTGRGWLLPLGLPPAAINNALLALRLMPGDVCAPV